MATQAAVDVDTVRQITNPADITRLLIDAVAWERSIDANLEALLASSASVDATLAGLRVDTAESLEMAKAEAVQLCASTADTATLAEKVSKKVRELDAAQSRVRACLARIEVILDRSNAVDGVQAALERGDLEAAAGCVARFLEIQEEEASVKDRQVSVPSATTVTSSLAISEQEANQAAAMADWKTKLESVVRSKMSAAVAARDHAAVVRFARLFGPLRLAHEGVNMLTGYLRVLIGERAQQDYTMLIDAYNTGMKADYVGSLTNLFRDVATAIDEHLELFRDAYGPDVALAAVHSVHAECDVRGTALLQKFVEHRELARMAAQIGMRRRDDTSDAAAPIEPRRIEAFLSELLAVCTRGEEYTQYLVARMGEAVVPSQLPASRETALRGGPLATTLRELLSYYISLEEYYVEESVAKAVRIDEAVPGSLTTSMVDDTFFVVLSAGQRALATGRAPSAVAILNQLNTVLSTLYRSALARKLHGAAGRLAAAAPSSSSGTTGHETGAIIALAFNNADMSAQYVDKLRSQLESLTIKLFPASHDRDRIKLVIADLGKTAADFRRLSAQHAEQLCTSIIAHLRPLLDAFVDVSYEIKDAEGSDMAFGSYSGAPWAQAMLVAFASHFAWLQSLLTPTLFESVVQSAIDKIISRMEASVAQKRFTQLGGLQLERDVRALVGEVHSAIGVCFFPSGFDCFFLFSFACAVGLSEITSRSVRDKFGRLQQTATVLGVETPAEAAELISDGAVAWRLSALDVRQALTQRVDFTPAAVASVKFH